MVQATGHCKDMGLKQDLSIVDLSGISCVWHRAPPPTEVCPAAPQKTATKTLAINAQC